MKNLIIVHLESLNNLFLYSNYSLFENLNKLRLKSTYYNNYFSSATSTYMTILDLFLGGDPSFEKCDYLENIFKKGLKSKKSLFDILEEKKFFCKNFFLHFEASDKKSLPALSEIIGNKCSYWIGDSSSDFKRNFSESIQENIDGNFAFFVEDNFSHISYKNTNDSSFSSLNDWLRKRYLSIDRTIGIIFDCIKEFNKEKNTVILLYGDHGEEYWTHGLHGGYSHAIEPFTDLISCPLFLYDGENEVSFTSEKIISTLDISSLLLYKLGLKDDFLLSRKYAISRNLFVNQTKNSSIFNKSYSITDSEYNLILDKEGYSLFLNNIDPTCHFNILSLFKIRNDTLTYNKIFSTLLASHFKSFITEQSLNEISAKFWELKKELDNYLNTYFGLKITTKLLIKKNYRFNYFKLTAYYFIHRGKKIIKKVFLRGIL